METTIFVVHLPCLNFAVYTVHMQCYMLPSHPMGSIYKVLKSSDVMHSYNQSFGTSQECNLEFIFLDKEEGGARVI